MWKSTITKVVYWGRGFDLMLDILFHVERDSKWRGPHFLLSSYSVPHPYPFLAITRSRPVWLANFALSFFPLCRGYCLTVPADRSEGKDSTKTTTFKKTVDSSFTLFIRCLRVVSLLEYLHKNFVFVLDASVKSSFIYAVIQCRRFS